MRMVCVGVCVCSVMSDSFVTSYTVARQVPLPTRLLCPWNFPGKDTGVECHFLLQGIFPIQGSNLHLLHHRHWQADSLPLPPSGNPCEDGDLINEIKRSQRVSPSSPLPLTPCSNTKKRLFFCEIGSRPSGDN